ncbi:MAG TPA: hypothetical protein DCW29_17060 [Janthinobacterium sp.]|nr:hypothetical protein [Janthinobacterium sp.]
MKTALSAALICLAGMAAARAEPSITVSWRDKPPYHYIEDGREQGFLLKRTRAVFAAAGIAAHFVEEPQKRIWANFEHGASNYCSISWYRLPAREAFAQFSHPLHVDPPQALLIAAEAVPRVRAHATLAALLADPRMTLGVVDGVSYGADIDAMIAGSANRIMRRTVSVTVMIRMLAAGRASYMFVDRDDWRYYSKHDPAPAPAVLYAFPDMPAGMKRYLICSRDVAPAVMDKLNRAIDASAP